MPFDAPSVPSARVESEHKVAGLLGGGLLAPECGREDDIPQAGRLAEEGVRQDKEERVARALENLEAAGEPRSARQGRR